MSASTSDPLWPRSFWSDVPDADRAALREVLAELLGRGVLLGDEGSGRELYMLARDHYRTQSKARGTWRASNSAAGYSSAARRACWPAGSRSAIASRGSSSAPGAGGSLYGGSAVTSAGGFDPAIHLCEAVGVAHVRP